MRKKKKKERKERKIPSPGGLEPPTFRLTAERANRLRHGDNVEKTRENIVKNLRPTVQSYSPVPPMLRAVSLPNGLLNTCTIQDENI